MKEKIARVMLKVVERVIRNEVQINNIWPPKCVGIYHQPKRPKNI